jgi:hypothetical protein
MALSLLVAACGGKSIPGGNVHQEPGGAATSGQGPSAEGSGSGTGIGGTGIGGTGIGGTGIGGTGTANPAGSGGSGSSVAPPEASDLTDGGGGDLGHTGRGCGMGTSCRPGSDLPVPAEADGIQIVTPPGMFTVAPGQEIFPNYCATVPGNAEFDVGTVQSWMTPGSSHELIVYQGGTASSGTAGSCVLGANKWLYMASIPGEIVELKMPDGVGVPLPASTQIILNMHFINTGTSSLQPQVKVNLLRARNLQYTAGAMVSFNSQIDVPAASGGVPGTQTVRGTCSVPAGVNFFAYGAITNSRGTAADVNFASGGVTTNIVHTTDWQNPDVGVWLASPFFATYDGDSFMYSCSYSNPGTQPVTVGETAQSNEKCMSVGYYFPTSTTASCQ